MHTLIKDNDGHWYVIQVNQKDEFYQWVAAQERCDATTQLPTDFNALMINSPTEVIFPSYKIV